MIPVSSPKDGRGGRECGPRGTGSATDADGAALTAIADDGDFLALDEGDVRILLVIDFHGPLLAPLGGD